MPYQPDSTSARVPDWIIILRRVCHQTSQRRAATAIGYSPTVVSLVLAGTYGGDLAAVEARVRTRLMDDGLTCPVKGEISVARCLEFQAEPFNAASSMAVKLWRACRTCPNNRKGGQ